MIAKTLSTIIVLTTFASPALAQKAPSWEEAPGPDETADPESDANEPSVAPEEPSPPAAPAARAETKPKPEPTAHASRESEHHQQHHRHHRRWHRAGGGLSLSIGKARVSADELDARLQALGYEPLSDRAITFGISGTKVFKSGWVLGIGASYTRGRESDGPNGATARLEMGHLYGLVGATIVDTRRWLIYPGLMLGGYRSKLSIDASDSTSFDEVAQEPARSVELDQRGWFVGGLVAIDRRIAWHRDRSRYTSIGLRLGVMESVSATGWRFGDDEAGQGPDARPRVAFVAIALGFGRYGAQARF